MKDKILKQFKELNKEKQAIFLMQTNPYFCDTFVYQELEKVFSEPAQPVEKEK
jgi:hypothetical protein